MRGMTTHIGMLLFPRLTQLDLTGPYEFFHRIPNTRVHLLWKTLAPVHTEAGFGLLPTMTLAECPPLDVVFVPGGIGQVDLMADEEVLGFLRQHGTNARYVTSVCTGALVLGAAGLLAGYQATTHWAYLDELSALGASVTKGRVVRDRNRITAGGVTAGLDFGLMLAAELAGEAFAKELQLGLEYDPAPPFRSGHPDLADPALVEKVRARLKSRRAAPSS